MAKKRAASPADDMRIEYVALDDLRKWPKNPKDHDLATLDESFNEFGYVDPIVVDEATGMMVKGHGRLEQLEVRKKANLEPPARVRVRADGAWMIPVVRGIRFKNRRQAERYVVADNRISQLGGWDSRLLGELMKGWDPSDLKGVGFSEKDLVHFVSLPDLDADPVTETEPTPSEYCCPKCHHEWSGPSDPLGRLARKAR